MELVRALDPERVGRAGELLEHVARHEIDRRVRVRAASFPDPALRSLDAVHLATAALLGDREPTVLVTYDRRLIGAARSAWVTVASPGAEDGPVDH